MMGLFCFEAMHCIILIKQQSPLLFHVMDERLTWQIVYEAVMIGVSSDKTMHINNL